MIHNELMGRPTSDPKTELVAFRLPPRHIRLLSRLARRDGVTFSEALRRMLDDAIGAAARKAAKKRSNP